MIFAAVASGLSERCVHERKLRLMIMIVIMIASLSTTLEPKGMLYFFYLRHVQLCLPAVFLSLLLIPQL